jgi:hypothetical protein
MTSPSSVLAESIITRLKKEGLLTAEDGEKMKQKLAEGKLNAADWKLAVEKATLNGGKK